MQANILSFDEARRASRAKSPGRSRNYDDSARTREGSESREGRGHSAGGRNQQRSRSAVRTQDSPRGARTTTDRRSRSTRNQADRRSRSGNRSQEIPRTSQAASRTRAQSQSRAQSQTSAAEARERKRRQKAKNRADRMFDRQFAADETRTTPAQEDGAPRAALYEGKMGASQRRSARMQRASSAGPASAKINPAGWFTGLNVSARTLKLGTAALCLVLAVAFLYTPAQQFYQAQRENDRLAAEYAVVEQRNEAIDAQNDTLASDAGMEDAVRQKYGYVRAGDQTAVVSGLSDDAVGTAVTANNSGIEANVLSSTVKAPEEWYTPFLDALFGVQ